MSALAPLDQWKEVYRRFDPERPVALDQPGWRAERPHSPLPAISDDLQIATLTRESARILLLGTKGTGKTTELRLLADQRKQEDFVLFLDLVQFFALVVKNPNGLYQIKPWEIYHLVGLSLYQAAVERFAYEWPAEVLAELEKAWRAVSGQATAAPTPVKVDLAKAATLVFQGASLLFDGGATMGAVAGLVEKAVAGWTLPLGQGSVPVEDSRPEILRLVEAVNRVITEIQSTGRQVLLILDGLDRLTELEAARSLFLDSRLLSAFPCNVVLSGPFVLRHHPAATSAPGFKLLTLVNEPVLRREAPDRIGDVDSAFFRELFRLRVQDLFAELPLADETLNTLVYFSGGRARDFVRLIRSVAGKMLLSKPSLPAVVPAALVAQVVDEARRTLEMGLYDVHFDLLRGVLADSHYRLPEHPATWLMLETFRLLPYPNEHEWFYPHTLLLKWLRSRP